MASNARAPYRLRAVLSRCVCARPPLLGTVGRCGSGHDKVHGVLAYIPSARSARAAGRAPHACRATDMPRARAHAAQHGARCTFPSACGLRHPHVGCQLLPSCAIPRTQGPLGAARP